MNKRIEVKPYLEELYANIRLTELNLKENDFNSALESIKQVKSFLNTTETYIKNEIRYREKGKKPELDDFTIFKVGQLVEFLHTEKEHPNKKSIRYHKGDVGRVVGFTHGYQFSNITARVKLPGKKYAINIKEEELKLYRKEK